MLTATGVQFMALVVGRSVPFSIESILHAFTLLASADSKFCRRSSFAILFRKHCP